MAKQRFKRIEAGRLVREVLWTASFPSDSPKARAEKAKCSTAARQNINDRYSWQKLKMLLAANFSGSDLVLTLTYDDAHLPTNRTQARTLLRKFIELLRTSRRKQGFELRYIYNIESKHGDARIHHHLALNGTGDDYDLIRSIWAFGADIHIASLDVFGYEELAKYLTKEPRECGHSEVGAKAWVSSQNLKKPKVYPTQWVDGSMRLEPPANAHRLRSDSFENEWGRFAYVEYLLPEPPKAVRMRPRSRKKNKDAYFSSLEQCITSDGST